MKFFLMESPRGLPLCWWREIMEGSDDSSHSLVPSSRASSVTVTSEDSIPFPCNLCVFLGVQCTISNSAECASRRQLRVRCSLILSSDKLELYASYARIHKAIPESQSKVVAANEKKMNTYLPTLQQPATGF